MQSFQPNVTGCFTRHCACPGHELQTSDVAPLQGRGIEQDPRYMREDTNEGQKRKRSAGDPLLSVHARHLYPSYPHFTDEKTKTQRRSGFCQGPQLAEQGRDFRSGVTQCEWFHGQASQTRVRMRALPGLDCGNLGLAASSY